MAIFNPEPAAVNAPDWTNVTRPVSQPEADKSTGMLLSTAGDILGEGVKIVDTGIKQDIKEKVDTGVDTLRDAYTQGLIQVRNSQIAANDQSLLPDTTNAPVQLESGLDRIKQLGTAMSQNGSKINDTLYTGALNAQAKQLRAQYPGYRDYIDEQIKSVSGMDPANAFYKNLMEDINKNAEASKTQTNSILTTLKDNADKGYHDGAGTSAATVYSLVQKGLLTPDKGLEWLNSGKKLEYDNKTLADARAKRQGDDADAVVQTSKDLTQTSYKTINQAWSTMTMGKGTDTFSGMVRFLQDPNNQANMTDEKAQAMGQAMQSIRTRTALTLLDQAQRDGSVAKLGGDPAKAKALIEASLAPMDLAIQDVFNKDWGSAYAHMNFNKAIGADTGNVMLNAPDASVRNYIRGSQYISSSAPEYARELQRQMLLSPIPEKEKAWYQGVTTDLLYQPGEPVGKLTSVQGVIQKGKTDGITSPKTYDEVINRVKDLANPQLDTPTKLKLAKAFFDPQANAGLLSDKNFTMDHYDDVLKRQVPGKLSVFTRLTAPEVADSIAKLGKTNPEVVNNYRTMLSREFGEQLYSRELKDLAQSNQDYTANSLYRLKFTNDSGSSPHFVTVDPSSHKELTMTEASQRGAPVQSINRLNTGMAGMYTAFNGTGSKDATNDVMKVMQMYGYEGSSDQGSALPGMQSQYSGIGNLVTAFKESIKAAQRANLPKPKAAE